MSYVALFVLFFVLFWIFLSRPIVEFFGRIRVSSLLAIHLVCAACASYLVGGLL